MQEREAEKEALEKLRAKYYEQGTYQKGVY